MYTCLDEVKTVQIAARFLKHTDGKDTNNYTKLIKLLYLTDREALKRWNCPLTGDEYYWMDNGPVLSGVFDRIKKTSAPLKTYWNSCFETKGFNLRIKKDPGEERLPFAVKQLIDSLFDQFRDYSYVDMITYTHTALGERLNVPKGGTKALSYERILLVIGKAERAAQIAEEIENTNYLRATIGSC